MEESTKISAEIEQLTVHEAFSSDYLHDTEDTGLIELKYPIRFNSAIKPVCLPRLGESTPFSRPFTYPLLNTSHHNCSIHAIIKMLVALLGKTTHQDRRNR
jgi:hypothetical protein